MFVRYLSYSVLICREHGCLYKPRIRLKHKKSNNTLPQSASSVARTLRLLPAWHCSYTSTTHLPKLKQPTYFLDLTKQYTTCVRDHITTEFSRARRRVITFSDKRTLIGCMPATSSTNSTRKDILGLLQNNQADEWKPLFGDHILCKAFFQCYLRKQGNLERASVMLRSCLSFEPENETVLAAISELQILGRQKVAESGIFRVETATSLSELGRCIHC
jgi:hypothetical protein